MAYFDEVPEELRGWQREQRIEWYERRVRKYLPAYALIEEIVSEKTVEEVEQELSSVRAEIAEIEAQIFVLESSNLSSLRNVLADRMLDVKKVRAEKIKLLISNLRQTNQGELQEVDGRMQTAINQAQEIETRIVELCKANNVTADPYLQLKHIVSAVRNSEDKNGS